MASKASDLKWEMVLDKLIDILKIIFAFIISINLELDNI